MSTAPAASRKNGGETPPPLAHITLDHLSLKIAETPEEILAAQRLRFDVFYTELGAHPVGDMAQTKHDYDAYDPICDHLLVIDNNAPQGQQIVGTYRMLSLKRAQEHGVPLYTETEYDLSKLKATGGVILEFSRSCVLPAYRSKMVINLLWRGIAAYVFHFNADYLVGVPSFNGTDISEQQDTLAYLNAFHLADETIRPRAVDGHYIPFPQIPKEQIDVKSAFMKLPPLIKGYLRVGAVFGDGAYIDHQFNMIDVALVLEIAKVDPRYFDYYKRGDNDAR